MKRLAFLICVILYIIATFAITPEELNGEWEAKKWEHMRTNIPEITVHGRDSYDFFTDGTFITRMKLQIRFAVLGQVNAYVTITYRGGYSISDDFVTLMPDNSTIRVATPKDEIEYSGPDLGVYETPIKRMVGRVADDVAELLRKNIKTEYLHDVTITEDKKWRKMTYHYAESKKVHEYRQKIEKKK